MKRVLHVVMTMDTGGVENWLLHVVRRLDPTRIRFEFAVATGQGGAYVEEMEARGARVHFLGCGRDPVRLASRLARLLRRHGPYDAIHGHLHHVNGVVGWVGARAKVPLRIAHSHLDTSYFDARGGPVRAFYRRGLRRMIQRYANVHLAVSARAADSLFGLGWRDDPRVRILPCGLDYSRFSALPDKAEARRRVGLPADAVVFGSIGRLEVEKNHAFLFDVMAALRARLPDARLVLVGKGSLEAALRARARALGLAEQVLFAGARDDVPELLAAMDLFLFPSLFEGLGLAPIEAQAAGIPCLISDQVPSEVILFPDRVRALPLGDAARWAAHALELLGLPRLEGAAAAVEASPFGMEAHLSALLSVYDAAPRARRVV